MIVNNKLKIIILSTLLSAISLNSFAEVLDPNNIDPFKKKEEQPQLDLSQRIKITDVVIRGTDRKAEISLIMAVKPGNTVSEDKIKEDIQNIYNLGYFNENINYTKEPYLDGYRLIVNVTENPLLRNIQVKGNTIVKVEDIKKEFSDQIGKTINFNELKLSLEHIRDKYTEGGYRGVFINPQISQFGDMTLYISEGIIEEIKITGNKETKDYVIRRELRQKAGQIYNANIFEDDRRRLMNTNFFEKVDLKFARGQINPNNLIVVVDVKEQLTGNFLPGISYSWQSGLTGNIVLSKDNLFGNGQNVDLNLSFGGGWFAATSGYNFLGRVDWNEPWFMPDIFGPRMGLGVSLYRQRENNLFQTIPAFSSTVNGVSSNYVYPLNDDRTGFGLSLSKAVFGDPLTSPFRIGLNVRAESIAPVIPSIQDTQLTQGNTAKSYNDLANSSDTKVKDSLNQLTQQFNSYADTNIRKGLTLSKTGFDNRLATGVTLSYDTRDYYMQPHNGWFSSLLLEPSFGDISYFKTFLTVNKYSPIPFTDNIPYLNEVTFALSGNLGILSGDKISIYEKFYSNGNYSIRGWPENGYLVGDRIFIGSAELRLPIYSIVSGVLFFDCGNFWDQSWHVTDANVNDSKLNGKLVDQTLLNQFLRTGFGLGLRANTPFGLFRLDYGIRDISKPFDLSKGAQIHFNIGQKF